MWHRRLTWACGFITLIAVSCAPRGEVARAAEGRQEVWVYARGNEFLPKEVKLKALRPVSFEVTSVDVDYKVEFPGLGVGPIRVPANKTAMVSFTPMSVGTYEFLGTGKTGMKGTIVVQVCPPEAESLRNPLPPDEQSLKLGGNIFSQNCASCHGSNGKGNGPQVKNLHTKPIDLTQPFMERISDGELFWTISEGWDQMPSFKRKLGENERWQLVNYLRSLSRAVQD